MGKKYETKVFGSHYDEVGFIDKSKKRTQIAEPENFEEEEVDESQVKEELDYKLYLDLKVKSEEEKITIARNTYILE